MIDFFEFKFNELAVLNKYVDNKINKLKVLSLANDLGIKVPDTFVLDDFCLLNFENENYITKAVSDLVIVDNDTSFYSMTQRVEFEDVKIFPIH